nr:hypothetical protein CFP56_02320 [Quercus suber]POE89602.1 hypothetical protein CFP56_02321 [Quercus suber]
MAKDSNSSRLISAAATSGGLLFITTLIRFSLLSEALLSHYTSMSPSLATLKPNNHPPIYKLSTPQMARGPQEGYVEAKSLTGQPRSTTVVAREDACVQKQRVSAGSKFVCSAYEKCSV